MKSYRRYLSVLLCLVVLFGVFSVNAFANDQIENKPYNVYSTAHLRQGTTNSLVSEVMLYPNDGTTQNVRWEKEIYYSNYNPTKALSLTNTYYFANNDNTAFMTTGSTYNIALSKLYENAEYFMWNSNLVAIAEGKFISAQTPIVQITLYDGNGTAYGVEGEKATKNGTMLTVSASITPTVNVTKIAVSVTYDIAVILKTQPTVFSHLTLTGVLGEQYGSEYVIDLTKADKTDELIEEQNGLIARIIAKVEDVFQSIIELPAKIWEKIESGLQKLFVPNVQQVSNYQQMWEDLMADRFGAVYQASTMLFDSFDGVSRADQIDSIEVPRVTIPLPENETFSFGGDTVKIVPDGFGFVATSCKAVTGIVATLYFVNGLRRRYDEVMGVEQ